MKNIVLFRKLFKEIKTVIQITDTTVGATAQLPPGLLKLQYPFFPYGNI